MLHKILKRSIKNDAILSDTPEIYNARTVTVCVVVRPGDGHAKLFLY